MESNDDQKKAGNMETTVRWAAKQHTDGTERQNGREVSEKWLPENKILFRRAYSHRKRKRDVKREFVSYEQHALLHTQPHHISARTLIDNATDA